MAKGFVLGVLRNSLSTDVSIGVLKERVLWQWGIQEGLFDELLRAIHWLAEHKLIEFTSAPSAHDQMRVRLKK
jgi:hypothetical protein